jgi:hypothetical protein
MSATTKPEPRRTEGGLKTWLILDQIARNAVMSIPAVARWRSRRGRTSVQPDHVDSAYLEIYGYSLFNTVVDHIGISALEGKRVGEIGPGDHIPSALLFLGAGAERYLCYDRFAGDIGGPFAKGIYRALVEDLRRRNPEISRRLDQLGIDPSGFPEAYPALVQPIFRSIETVDADEHGNLDLLTSHNVVEHVYDVPSFAERSFQLLRPGSMAIHRVDFGPHGRWEQRANPLEGLTVPDRVWAMMGSKRGIPNRRRFHEILTEFDRVGFVVETEVRERFDAEADEAIRGPMAPRFRKMPLDSLLVKTACFYCRRQNTVPA